MVERVIGADAATGLITRARWEAPCQLQPTVDEYRLANLEESRLELFTRGCEILAGRVPGELQGHFFDDGVVGKLHLAGFFPQQKQYSR